MSKIRVAVLRGGPSSEYDVSLQTGAAVIKNLPDKYEPLDILIDKSGVWHMSGLAKSPDKILYRSDVVFNALHGAFGEDGQVQHILHTHNIPFTGSGVIPSSFAMNKVVSKDIFEKAGLKTPQHVLAQSTDDVGEQARAIFKSFLMPAIVKPVSGGSSVGISVVQTISELADALARAFRYGRVALVEEFIRGKEAMCGVVEGFRGDMLHALMPIEIRPKGKNTPNDFFDYNAKYESDAKDQTYDEICPGNFSASEKKTLEDYARRAHAALGLSQYSRSDFIVAPRRGVYILETNSLPGLTEQSLLPKSLAAGGTSLPIFLDHILSLALAK